MAAVENLIEQLSLGLIPVIRVFNKRDLVDQEVAENVCSSFGGIAISAKDSKSFPPLITRMEDEIMHLMAAVTNPDHDGRSISSPGASECS